MIRIWYVYYLNQIEFLKIELQRYAAACSYKPHYSDKHEEKAILKIRNPKNKFLYEINKKVQYKIAEYRNTKWKEFMVSLRP